MLPEIVADEELLRRLPLPLAQLYRRAFNAKTHLERHLAAFYLWEASVKLLASTAIVEYARRPEHDPDLAERLRNLARPSLGHWWEFVRRLVPILADTPDEGFRKVRDLLLGRSRDDCPRAAGLDAALREALDGQSGARSTVRFTELYDRLVNYRNKELGHGATGQRPGDFYGRMGRALLAGMTEVLGKLDVLAGRRLLYVADVRQSGGAWLVQRYELIGEAACRIESLELPRSETTRLPDAERVYLAGPAADMQSLHPLLIYDAETEEVSVLNARRGSRRTEYLCYTTGGTTDRPDLGGEQRQLLSRVLGLEVAEEQVTQWQEHSHAEEPAAETQPEPGRRTLGEFELLSELGRGGMGVVFRAWQPSLGRQVALKKLLHSGDTRTETRFRREIRALGKVEHPHLVRVFTSGSDGDQWFYAMELLEGAPLSAVCQRLSGSGRDVTRVDLQTWQDALSSVCAEARQKEKHVGGAADTARSPSAEDTIPPPLPAGRDYVRHVVELMRQVAEAAHALHEAGVIHRDIKPGNIMVSADGSQAVLMDLGLAQLADDEEGRLTRTRQFVGTLRYASPQQVLAVDKLDRRSDVYSLGATLWELLTLRPLFGATEQTPTPELMEKIQHEEPERLRKYHPGIPKDLEAVLQRCLEKSAGRRYPSAHALAEELRRFQRGEPVQARPVGRLERGWRWCRRRPAVASLLAVVVLLLLLSTSVGWVLAVYAAGEAKRALNEKERADGQAREALHQKGEADKARKRAEAGERAAKFGQQQAEFVAYVFRLREAQADLKAGRLDQAQDILRQCDPKLCAWEHDYLLRQTLLASGVKRHNGPVHSVCFSPNGKRIASASWDGTVKVWDAAKGREPLILKLKGSWKRFNSVAFNFADRRTITGSDDQTVKVWSSGTGRELASLRGHTGPVLSVACSFSGFRDMIASGSADKTVKVWIWPFRREALSLRGHTGSVTSVTFSPSDNRIASGSVDKTSEGLGSAHRPGNPLPQRAHWCSHERVLQPRRQTPRVGELR